MKEKLKLANVTMQSFVFCPFFVVASDPTCQSGANISTISYVGVLSEQPPIVGLAIRPEREIHRLIKAAGEFSLCLPTVELLADLDFCGTFSGKTHCKAFLRGIEMESNSVIQAPAIKRSPVIMECRLKNLLPLADEGASHDYFIAEVVAARREKEFRIEDSAGPVTTNLDYRRLGEALGKAFHCWRDETEGG